MSEPESLLIDFSNYTDEEIKAAWNSYPALWVLWNGIKQESGEPIEFNDHNFMWDIYNDLSPFCAVLKPPQVGMTTAQILKALWIAKKEKKEILYTLPTEDAMYEMVSGTFNRLIAQNPILQSWVEDSDTMSHKSVGDSMIRFRGTQSPTQAISYPSDLSIHDEIDASDADNIALMETRQQAQANPMRWYFSHPSIAGYGVDIYWQRSDKREWTIVCPICEKRQILTWPDSLDTERQCYQCKYCKAEISDGVRRKGKWLPTAVGTFRGYHISQLMCPWKTATAILESREGKPEAYFYNYVLGLPYVGSENKITSDVVLKNVVPEINEQADRIIIGVDTGLPIHYTCMNKQGAFYYATCRPPSAEYDPYSDLEKLLLRWPTSIIIADQGGDLIGIRKLQAKYPGRVYLVYYRKDRKSKEMIEWGENNELGTVRVDRNNYMQWMVEQLRDVGRIRLNGKVEEWKDWAAHFDNIYREIKVALDKPGKDVATNYGAELIWKRNGPDHYVHTLLYCLVGLDKYGSTGASFIKRDDIMRFPMASKQDNVIPARRVLGKKIQHYANPFD